MISSTLALQNKVNDQRLIMHRKVKPNPAIFTQNALVEFQFGEQNKALDKGTNPPEVERIINRIKDYTLGYKLPGAGGGGYLYMVAKDPTAALRIRKTLEENRPNDKARLAEMKLSRNGFQDSRS